MKLDRYKLKNSYKKELIKHNKFYNRNNSKWSKVKNAVSKQVRKICQIKNCKIKKYLPIISKNRIRKKNYKNLVFKNRKMNQYLIEA